MKQNLQITVDDEGRLLFIQDSRLDFLSDLGSVQTARASHVEPDAVVLRTLFHFLRRYAGEEGKLAEWTRNWKCIWRVNMGPSGGPILGARYVERSIALDAEVAWLESNIL